MRPAAIVIGLDSVTGLQTARLLARRGIAVWGIADNLSHFAARTRVCRKILQADTANDALIVLLEEIADRFAVKPVLYPCSDHSVLQISRSRARLEASYHFALPSHDVITLLMSKAAFAHHARQHGFRVPLTIDLHQHSDLEGAIARLRFPCVLKPALKDARWLSHSGRKAFKIASPDELIATFAQYSSVCDHFIVQEWIEGPESDQFTCNCYFDQQGRPVVTYVSRKIRQWPPGTGVGCLAVECRDDRVRDETVRLFQSVPYSGLAYAEMKLDRSTGDLVLIEPNVGRPTGRSAMAEASGVELLYSMYCDLTGSPLPDSRSTRGRPVKWIYLRRDLQAGLRHMYRRELSPLEWVRSLRGPKIDAVWSLSDPMPFVIDWLRHFRIGGASAPRGRDHRAPARTSHVKRKIPRERGEPARP
jgi:predicted ATP-grasp superfamily ATP-dependent carboligase